MNFEETRIMKSAPIYKIKFISLIYVYIINPLRYIGEIQWWTIYQEKKCLEVQGSLVQ